MNSCPIPGYCPKQAKEDEIRYRETRILQTDIMQLAGYPLRAQSLLISAELRVDSRLPIGERYTVTLRFRRNRGRVAVRILTSSRLSDFRLECKYNEGLASSKWL